MKLCLSGRSLTTRMEGPFLLVTLDRSDGLTTPTTAEQKSRGRAKTVKTEGFYIVLN